MIEKIVALLFILLIFWVAGLLAGGAKRVFPKLFSFVSSAKAALPLMLGLNLLDGLSTWLVLMRYGKIEDELNPLIKFVVGQLGISAGLLAYKAIFCSVLVIIILRATSMDRYPRAALIFFLFVLCVNNLAYFILAGPS